MRISLDSIKIKFKQTCLNKYGVDNPSKYNLFKDKRNKNFEMVFIHGKSEMRVE